MSKKFLLISLALVLVLGLCTSAWAYPVATNTKNWVGLGDKVSWDDPDNWVDKSSELPGIPGGWDQARFYYGKMAFPAFKPTVDCVATLLQIRGGYDGPDEIVVNVVDGAYLTLLNYWRMSNAWAQNQDTINMSGGVVRIAGTAQDGKYSGLVMAYAGGSAENPGVSTLNMTGGLLNIQSNLLMGWYAADYVRAVVNLDGGTIVAGSLEIRALGTGTGITIADYNTGVGGEDRVLMLRGDQTLNTDLLGYIADGLIAPKNPAQYIAVEYKDGTTNPPEFKYMQADVTWVYAIPEPATIALLGLGGLALLRRRR